MQQIPKLDRPREKLCSKGAACLSDFELLEVLVGNGNASADVTFIARKIKRQLQNGADNVNHESLMTIKGVNTATASRVLASLEIARRYLVRDALPLTSLQDILARLADIRTKQQEHVICLSLDGGQRVIAIRTITVGTLDNVLIHPREIFADTIADRAASVIIAHNHPSGDPTPSKKDVTLTQQLAAGGQLLGISLRDHIIVTRTDYFSFRQHHLLYT